MEFFFYPQTKKKKSKKLNLFLIFFILLQTLISHFLSTNFEKKTFPPPKICAQKVTKLCSKKK
jgi:hypothetical protein